MNPYFKTEDTGTVYDVHDLFQYYNNYFFSGLLEKCSVRWTKRMTLCAGTCKYEGFGSSTISLSEPLLKFRTSNELKETLLHEMIHAYLFITDPESCKIDGGHGPPFVKIMLNINEITGLNLTVYHNFKDEVEYHRQHVWRCDGRCREQPPYFGYVRRAMNRKPQPADHWFAQHKRLCGGQFIKISSPERKNSKEPKPNKFKNRKKKTLSSEKTFSAGGGKSIADYIKQMDKNKKEKKQENTGEKIPEKRIKTLEEYCIQMEDEKKKAKDTKQS